MLGRKPSNVSQPALPPGLAHRRTSIAAHGAAWPFSHRFEHYKGLEPGKWLRVLDGEGPEAAKKEVTDKIENYGKVHAS